VSTNADLNRDLNIKFNPIVGGDIWRIYVRFSQWLSFYFGISCFFCDSGMPTCP
jgi:hypothetical protein